MKYICLIILLAFLTACPHTQPTWNGQLWAGKSEIVGIQRAQAEAVISCSDTQFDDFVCMKYDDLAELIRIIKSCKKWGNKRDIERCQRSLLNDKNLDYLVEALRELF